MRDEIPASVADHPCVDREVGHHPGDLAHLQRVEEPDHHRLHVAGAAGIDETRDRVEDDESRLERLDLPVHLQQVHLDAGIDLDPRRRDRQDQAELIREI